MYHAIYFEIVVSVANQTGMEIYISAIALLDLIALENLTVHYG